MSVRHVIRLPALCRLNYTGLLRMKGSGCSFLQQLTDARTWHAYDNSGDGITKGIIHSRYQQKWAAETGRLHDIRRPKLGNGWIIYLSRVTEHHVALLSQSQSEAYAFSLSQDTRFSRKRLVSISLSSMHPEALSLRTSDHVHFTFVWNSGHIRHRLCKDTHHNLLWFAFSD